MAASELLEEVAGAILDGTPVDWAAIESSVDPTDRSVIEQLRLLATLRDTHRSAWQTPAIKPERWGHLRVVEPLGRGCFGAVYRAWDTRLDREVALKLLPADSRADRTESSIIEEGRLLARVRHPNVATIYGAERIGDWIGLWMELVKGQTLEENLQHGKVFSASEAIDIGVELAGAIHAVHKAGLLHRDIKAQNVMVADDGRVVLMDFGTGHEADRRSDAVAGTPLYLAPELLAGGSASVRTDVYSLGVLLYHLLTKSYPVRAKDLRELRAAHDRGESTALASARPELSTKLTRVIERAIAADPDRRYATADALAVDLARLVRGPRIGRRGRAALVAAASVCVAWGFWESHARIVERRSPTRAVVASWFPAAAASTRPVDHPVLAVLPLENLSADPDSDYFADGLTEEIIRSLNGINGLEVKSRTSSFAFKGKRRNLKEVADQLGVNVVLEGSVQREGRRVRVIPRLVQVAGDVPLWSGFFERDSTAGDMFEINDGISRAIVTKLRLTLRTGQRRYDSDTETYDLYLRARARLGKRDGENANAAVSLLQQVISKNPGFAPAYASLADAFAYMSREPLTPGVAEEGLPLMEQAAAKALELDELLAEGHAAMGILYARKSDWDNAQKAFSRAIELNPSFTLSYTDYSLTTLLPLERLEEAERLLNTAARIDPLSADVHRGLALMKNVAGRCDEAIEHSKRALAIDPELPYADLGLARALTFAGRLTEALAIWEGKTTYRPDGTEIHWKDLPGWQHWMSFAYVMAGRRAEVERWAITHDQPYRRAVIYAALGDKDRTFEALNTAADANPPRVQLLLAYPEMRLLRGDPRLAALRAKLKLPPQ